MDLEYIHKHSSRLGKPHNTLMLLIPAIIFAIIVVLIFKQYYTTQVAVSDEKHRVLGEEYREIQP